MCPRRSRISPPVAVIFVGAWRNEIREWIRHAGAGMDRARNDIEALLSA